MVTLLDPKDQRVSSIQHSDSCPSFSRPQESSSVNMTKDMLIVKSAVTMDTSGNSESTTLMDLEPLVLYLRSRTGSEWDSFNATPEVQSITNHSSVDDFGSSCMCDDTSELDFGAYAKSTTSSAFWIFRFNFLFVTLVVMLADGLQGTSGGGEGLVVMTFAKLTGLPTTNLPL
jgi:hypothetical protein